MPAITGVFGEGGGGSTSPPKDQRGLKNWLNRLADALKRLASYSAIPEILRRQDKLSPYLFGTQKKGQI